MKKDNLVRRSSVRLLMLMLTLITIFGAGTSFGATIDVYLRADTFTKTMPDATVITMWGYVLTDSAFTPLPGELVKVPGPTLTAAAGDTLRIHIQNNLTGLFTEPTSVIIHGQSPSLAPGSFPTWTDGTTGPRADTAKRVRSFGVETPVAGTTVYTWTNLRPGTFLYQSGTHPAVQVQMGLYGPLIVNQATGQAYNDPSTAYDNQVVLLLSEIDPELHFSIESGLYGTPPPPPPATPLRGQRTSAEDYHPKYFLVNGEPYTLGLAPIPAGNANQDLLIRFLNAGLLEKTPTLQNHMTIIADDGNLLPYSKEQYSLLLPAGKTMDALLTPATPGYIPVYDRSLNLTNAAQSPGGDRVYLQVAAAAQYTLTVAKDGTGTGTITAQSLPGGIDCGLVCSQAYNAGTQIRLVASPATGSRFTNWTGGGCSGIGDCILTLNADTTVTGTFAGNAPKVRVLAPNGGEKIPANSAYVIQWEAPAAAETFRLEYKSGKKWVLIADGVQQSVYNWTVPAIAGVKKKAPVATSMVRVTGFNSAGKSIGSDTSDANFTIEMVRLTSPNGGETLTSGSTSPIQWTTFGTLRPVTQVVLQYQVKGGKKWLPITTITGSNPGSYDWLVPLVTAPPKPNSKVRVILRDAAGILGQDLSDAVFTITPAPAP